jgi:hypothetical protein
MKAYRILEATDLEVAKRSGIQNDFPGLYDPSPPSVSEEGSYRDLGSVP